MKVLDIKFLNKIDMSLVRKEFLDITNLCKLSFLPSSKSNKKREPPHGKRKSVSSRPRSLPSTEKLNINKRSKHQTESDSWEDDESTVSQVIHLYLYLSRLISSLILKPIGTWTQSDFILFPTVSQVIHYHYVL